MSGFSQRVRTWLPLTAATAVLCVVFTWLHLPAAPLLAAIIAGIAFAARGQGAAVPSLLYHLSQGLIGCMVARSLRPELFREIAAEWPLFLFITVAVIVLSSALGWFLAWKRVLPGATAVWGSSPGAAAAMVLMAESGGADPRLTAFMQYLRVVMVTVLAATVMRWQGDGSALPHHIEWFPAIEAGPFLATLAIVAAGVLLARRFRIPSGPLLAPMFIATLLQDVGGMELVLPPWLLLAGYVLIGWSVGLRFTRPLLRYALRVLPQLVLSIVVLIVACGGLAWLLHIWTGRDLLTAYLATSPGGADSVAIIAASSNVDIAFVMSMQMARFLIVLMVGPAVARFVANRVPAGRDAAGPA